MRISAALLVAAVAFVAAASGAAAQRGPRAIATGSEPTHIQLITSPPVALGNPTTLLGVLHDGATNQGVPGVNLSFGLLTTFGWLPVGNRTTDDSGKAALDYESATTGTFTVRVVFNGDAAYAPTNATAVFTVLPGASVRPAGLSSDTIIALVVLVVIGGVWSTYGFVVWQVAGIRSSRAEESEERRREHTREVKTPMEKEEESERSMRVPGTASNIPKAALALAIAGLVMAGTALAWVAIQSKPAAYTPGTVNLQIAVVPDLQGSGWDVWLPNELVVHQGDQVRLTIFNADEMPHGFQLDQFSVDQPLQPATVGVNGDLTPSRVTVTFTADTVGQFQFKCNVPCGAGHDYMIGTFVVLPD